MSRAVGASALAFIFLIYLVATAPARLLGLALPADQLVVQGFSGTLWQGGASRCLVRVGQGYLHLGAVNWQLDPWSLLWLTPRLRLDSTWGSQTISTGLALHGPQDVDLDQLEASFPADLLRQFVPVALAGVFSVQLEQLQVRAGLPVQGAGRVVWQDGAWLSPTGPVPLGSYALDFEQPAGAALAGEVLTLQGPVAAEGRVQLQDRSYAIDVLVRGEGPLEARLQQALSLVAQPVGEGYQVKLDGEF